MAVVVVAMVVVEWVLWLVGCGGWVFFFLSGGGGCWWLAVGGWVASEKREAQIMGCFSFSFFFFFPVVGGDEVVGL